MSLEINYKRTEWCIVYNLYIGSITMFEMTISLFYILDVIERHTTQLDIEISSKVKTILEYCC